MNDVNGRPARPLDPRILEALLSAGAGRGAAGPICAPASSAFAETPRWLVHAILENISDGVIVADKDGRVVLFTHAAERVLGLRPWEGALSDWSQALGCLREDRVTPFPPQEMPLARALGGEVVGDCVMFIRHSAVPEGRWIAVSGAPLRDDGQAVIGAVVVLRDIGDRRREVEHLRFLSNVVEQTADSVVVTTAEGVIEYVNPAFERITGYSREEVLGRTPRVLNSGLHGKEFFRDLWNTLLAGEVYRNTIANRRKNGEIFHSEQTITPMRNSSGAVTNFVSVAKDVTELRRANEREAKMRLARTVQQRLYPSAPPRVYGADIAGAAFPADLVGGDYFDFVCTPEGALGLVIGDVAGHGLDAALLMAETRALLRSATLVESDPAKILAFVNRLVTEDTADNQFITLLVAMLDPATRTLTYANAGHTPGFILGAQGEVKRELGSTAMPLGVFPDVAFGVAPTIALEPGDVIALWTDGVTEAADHGGAYFGADRALEIVRQRQHESAGEIVKDVSRTVFEFQGAPQVDDITCVVCKIDHAG